MPEQPRILYNFGLFENSNGNIAMAEEYLLKALKSEPDNYDFLYAVCTFYLEHKQNRKAVEFAIRLVDKYPENQAAKQILQAASQ